MKKIIYTVLVCSLVVLQSCKDKPGDDWGDQYQAHSEIFSIAFEGQLGEPVVDNLTNEISLEIYSDDYTAIAISDLVTSKDASSSVATGGTVSFGADGNTPASITITSVSGTSQTYNITAQPYILPIGSWAGTGTTPADDDKTQFHFGTFYNGFAIASRATHDGTFWAPWYWYGWGYTAEGGHTYFNDGVAAMDNTLSLVSTGAGNGVIEGTFTYGPGADGQMGSYEHTYTGDSSVFDVNDNYNLLGASGTWVMNLTDFAITFTSAGGKVANTSAGKGHWVLDGDNMTLFLDIDRTGLPSAGDAYNMYNATDPDLGHILSGTELELKFTKN